MPDFEHLNSLTIPWNPNYIAEKVHMLTIQKNGSGKRIASITYDGKPVMDYFVDPSDLEKAKELMITAS